MRSHRWKTIRAGDISFSIVFCLVVPALLVARPAFGRAWSEHNAKLTSTSRQIEMTEQQIQHLIDEKRKLHDEEKIAEIIKEIARLHKVLEKKVKSYEEERTHVRFDHPDRNDALERKYMRHRLRSADDMEKGLGIDNRLDRAKARAISVFPLPEEDSQKKITPESVLRKPAAADEADEHEKIRLVK